MPTGGRSLAFLTRGVLAGEPEGRGVRCCSTRCPSRKVPRVRRGLDRSDSPGTGSTRSLRLPVPVPLAAEILADNHWQPLGGAPTKPASSTFAGGGSLRLGVSGSHKESSGKAGRPPGSAAATDSAASRGARVGGGPVESAPASRGARAPTCRPGGQGSSPEPPTLNRRFTLRLSAQTTNEGRHRQHSTVHWQRKSSSLVRILGELRTFCELPLRLASGSMPSDVVRHAGTVRIRPLRLRSERGCRPKLSSPPADARPPLPNTAI